MDLTCPTFIEDETSDYGSRDNSGSDLVIGGFAVLEYPKGINLNICYLNVRLLSTKMFQRSK